MVFGQQSANMKDCFLKDDPMGKSSNPHLDFFVRSFKHLKNEGMAKLENFEQLSIEARNAGEMTDEEKKELTEIHVKNRSHISEKYTKNIKKKFESFLNSDNTFYLLKLNKRDILAFIRLQNDKREGHKTIGSFNITEGIKNLGIGSLFYEKVLEKESESNVLHGNTNPFYRYFKHHIEDYGFNADELIPFGESGEMHVGVTLDKRENEALISRHKTKVEIIRKFENGDKGEGYEVYSYDLEKEKAEFLDLLEKKLNNEGKLLTRYIVSPEDPNRVYITIEKKNY